MPVITTGLTIMSTYGSLYFPELPLRADQATVNRFCVDKGYVSGGTWTADAGRFSNDGGREMNYYGAIPVIQSGGTYVTEYHWLNYFGYDALITSITTP